MLKKLATTLCMSLILAAPSIAKDVTIKDYLVSMKIRAGADLIGQPAIKARTGKPATVELKGGYIIQVMATPDITRPGNVLLTSDITIKSSDIQRNQKSTVSLRPKETMTFNFAPLSNAVAGAPMQVEISAVGADS